MQPGPLNNEQKAVAARADHCEAVRTEAGSTLMTLQPSIVVVVVVVQLWLLWLRVSEVELWDRSSSCLSTWRHSGNIFRLLHSGTRFLTILSSSPNRCIPVDRPGVFNVFSWCSVTFMANIMFVYFFKITPRAAWSFWYMMSLLTSCI